MDTPVSAPVTPAVSAPESQSATHAAVIAGSPGDYRAARRAERAGTPLPAVPLETADDPLDAPEPAAAPAQPETRKTRAEKEQARINESIRVATEAATAPLRAELERLKTARPAPTRETPPAAEAPKTNTDAWKRYAALPEAPKLGQFESVEEHTAAMSFFIAQTMLAEERTTRDRESTDRRDREQREIVDRFVDRITAAKTADPQFLAKLTPEVKALKPFLGLQPGEAAGPANTVAEFVFRSPAAPQLLEHLAAQSNAELTRLTTVPAHLLRWFPVRAGTDGQGRPIDLNLRARAEAYTSWLGEEVQTLERRFTGSTAAAAAPAPKTLTGAPPPRADLGSRATDVVDPKTAAITSGNTGAYRALRRQERLAARGR